MDSHMDLSKLKVLELKRELKQRGLNTNGNKNELIDRLQEAMKSPLNVELNSSTLDTFMLEDVLLNDDDDDHPASETVLDSDVDKVLDDLSTTSSQPYDNGSHNKNGVEKKPKKIKLQRDIPFVDEKVNGDKVDEDFTNDDTSESKPKVIKLSGLSVKERLELRAKKFGTTLTGSAKLLARAERFGSLDGDKTKDLEKLKKRAERFGGASNPNVAMKEKLEARKARFAINK